LPLGRGYILRKSHPQVVHGGCFGVYGHTAPKALVAPNQNKWLGLRSFLWRTAELVEADFLVVQRMFHGPLPGKRNKVCGVTVLSCFTMV
jgi:hypothetical protein